MDIIALVEGLAHDNTTFFKFLEEMVHFKLDTHPSYSLPNGSVIDFHGGRWSQGRNFTVVQNSSSVKLHFRFIGHHNLGDNGYGLAAFFHPSVIRELMCEMALRPPDGDNCSPAHAVVLNSGQVRQSYFLLHPFQHN